MSGALLFWDVDTQADFMLPEGKLYVPGAERIVPQLARLTEFARRRRILVVASADAHLEGDAEFQLYPPHCLAGTPGQKKIPETLLEPRTVIPNRPTDLPGELGEYAQLIVEKQHLNVFTNPNTEALLERLGRDLDIVVYGVVTEICVAEAARGLLERGYRVRLVRDAVQHLEEAKSRAVLEAIERGGGRLVATEQVVSG